MYGWFINYLSICVISWHAEILDHLSMNRVRHLVLVHGYTVRYIDDCHTPYLDVTKFNDCLSAKNKRRDQMLVYQNRNYG